MGKQTINLFDTGAKEISSNIADLKVSMADHLLSQYDGFGVTDIRSIVNETKVGAWRRSNLRDIVRIVFSAT